MTKLKSFLVAIAFFALGTHHLFGQGCSDAGFCTINSFKPNSDDSAKVVNNRLKVGAFLGNADHSISAYGTYLEYNRQLNKKWGLDIKLTTLAQNGNGISTFGLSDIFVNANFKVNDRINLTLGSKIPLSDANEQLNNLPLPMDYQASLGTFDLIFGVSYEIKKIQWVVALQQPLTQNANQFMASDYPIDSDLRSFQSTNQFERAGDVLLRVSYPIHITSKLKLTPSILPIYHLTNDKYTDENNVTEEIVGSQGLTLNGNAYIDYEINSKNSIQLNLGMPFIVREARPDGLTRSFIANLEYSIRF
ncbi:hypothetical protein [Reichenbachiella ulvae]|uniref:MetA-pathway of phenol degradation n=1 Tax=Reichenbachiella ulvae TaxID=2980104 RepID=A0ABT3CQN3_9BACT|nr:hypothetical protein [Reichenbachiella ulvae]MCV9386020.1 hypothetical protein [Reichenbachiella ulvae]